MTDERLVELIVAALDRNSGVLHQMREETNSSLHQMREETNASLRQMREETNASLHQMREEAGAGAARGEALLREANAALQQMREDTTAATDRFREESLEVLQGMWKDMKGLDQTFRRELALLRERELGELRERLDRVESHVGLR
jgi:uncharacterized protein involved in exopolysaccharide biosynthesis